MIIERADYESALEVFANLRVEDEWEISRLGSRDDILSELVNNDSVFVARVDNAAACLFGTVPGNGGVAPARLWLVTTPLVERKWVHLARLGYEYVQNELRKHGVIECFVLCRNERAVRWLKWMGFEGTLEELPQLGQVIRFGKRL